MIEPNFINLQGHRIALDSIASYYPCRRWCKISAEEPDYWLINLYLKNNPNQITIYYEVEAERDDVINYMDKAITLL